MLGASIECAGVAGSVGVHVLENEAVGVRLVSMWLERRELCGRLGCCVRRSQVRSAAAVRVARVSSLASESGDGSEETGDGEAV